MTKEEILDKTHWDFVVEKGISCVHSKTFPEAYRRQAGIAMDEYAKQQAIGFRCWCDENEWEIDQREERSHTYAELYQLFLNHK